MRLRARTQMEDMCDAIRKTARPVVILTAPRPGGPVDGSGDRATDTRSEALAAISDDPVVQAFYDRITPADITPAAWLPFWPGVWSESTEADGVPDCTWADRMERPQE